MAWRLWLQSYQGRVFLQGSAFAVSFSCFSAYFAPQSLFLEQYKEFVQCYTKGIQTPVSKKVKTLYEQVLQDCKISQQDKHLLEIFTVYGFDLFHAGSTIIRSGAIIGIPVNFSYDVEDDVDRQIKVVTKSVDWESEPGKKLRSSLVLSDDAKRFGIAREVVSTRGLSVWLYSLYPTTAVLASYMIARLINDKLRIRSHPFRFIMYSLVGFLNFAIYCAATDITTSYNDLAADDEVARLGAGYAAGGLEFYKKLRERNKALRELMEEVGAKQYTISGNEVVFVRTKTAPLSERLRHLEQVIKEIENAEGE